VQARHVSLLETSTSKSAGIVDVIAGDTVGLFWSEWRRHALR